MYCMTEGNRLSVFNDTSGGTTVHYLGVEGYVRFSETGQKVLIYIID